MERVNQIVETFADGDWRLDIVTENGVTMGWIYRARMGVKSRMFGGEGKREPVAELLLEHFSNPDSFYRAEYDEEFD